MWWALFLSHEVHHPSQADCHSGKRSRRGSSVTPGATTNISSLTTSSSESPAPCQGALSVYCSRHRRSFLVDSGADVSVYPASAAKKIVPGSTVLHAANGSVIQTFGSKVFSLSLPNLSVSHRFLLANVKRPILGSDFFRAHDLLIDISRQCLVKGPSLVDGPVVKARPARFNGGLFGLKCHSSAVLDLFATFPSVTKPTAVFDSSRPAKHGLTHTIPTTGPPVFARARRLFGEKLDVARAEFQKMMDLGIIRPSSSPWASPLHVVPKANGG